MLLPGIEMSKLVQRENVEKRDRARVPQGPKWVSPPLEQTYVRTYTLGLFTGAAVRERVPLADDKLEQMHGINQRRGPQSSAVLGPSPLLSFAVASSLLLFMASSVSIYVRMCNI